MAPGLWEAASPFVAAASAAVPVSSVVADGAGTRLAGIMPQPARVLARRTDLLRPALAVLREWRPTRDDGGRETARLPVGDASLAVLYDGMTLLACHLGARDAAADACVSRAMAALGARARVAPTLSFRTDACARDVADALALAVGVLPTAAVA